VATDGKHLIVFQGQGTGDERPAAQAKSLSTDSSSSTRRETSGSRTIIVTCIR